MVDHALGSPPRPNPAEKLHAMLAIQSTVSGVAGADGPLAPSAQEALKRDQESYSKR